MIRRMFRDRFEVGMNTLGRFITASIGRISIENAGISKFFR
jgi:hypothetical protein